MKVLKILLALFSFICLQAIGYCDVQNKPNISEKIYWGNSSPSAVAAKANQNSSINSDSSSADPSLYNPMGAYGNMLQMMNPMNSYSGIEMQKQQADYVKQQVSD